MKKKKLSINCANSLLDCPVSFPGIQEDALTTLEQIVASPDIGTGVLLPGAGGVSTRHCVPINIAIQTGRSWALGAITGEQGKQLNASSFSDAERLCQHLNHARGLDEAEALKLATEASQSIKSQVQQLTGSHGTH